MKQAIGHMALSPEWIIGIAQSLAGQVDLRAAVTSISGEMQPFIPHDHIDVALMTGAGDALVVYETGLETSWGRMLGRVDASPIRDLLYGHHAHMIFADAVVDDRVRFTGADIGPIRTFGLRARLHHRIGISGKIIGALSVSSLQPDVYSEDHLAAIRTVANVAGPYFHILRASELAQKQALELQRQHALRLEARHLVEAQEKERNRIGMDLHDQVLADMSRLLRSLDDPAVPEGQRLRAARSGLSSAIQDVRDIVENAHPALLSMFGLGTAIEAYLLKAARGTGVQALMATPSEEIDACLDICQRDRLLLFRILQEAVNNAIRHAGASRIRISLSLSDTHIALIVDDDGTGFSLQPGSRQGGIKNMGARAAMVGADLRMAMSAGGTCITLALPRRTGEAGQRGEN